MTRYIEINTVKLSASHDRVRIVLYLFIDITTYMYIHVLLRTKVVSSAHWLIIKHTVIMCFYLQLLNSLKHKIQLYKDLERHLQQARTKALSEDEQHLTRMREQYSSCDNPSLMRHTSLISSHLDTALLREHGLLTPTDCLPASIPTRNIPPKGTCTCI